MNGADVLPWDKIHRSVCPLRSLLLQFRTLRGGIFPILTLYDPRAEPVSAEGCAFFRSPVATGIMFAHPNAGYGESYPAQNARCEMRGTETPAATDIMVLKAHTASDLMTPSPVSIQYKATVAEATALLTDRGFSAAPVIDEAGRAVGVISRTDLLVHDREHMTHMRTMPESADPLTRRARWQEPLPEGFSVEEVDPTMVCDIMTPVVFSVLPETTVEQVIEDMLGLRVHQLFVVDRNQVLVGVISALDVLRHLRSMHSPEM